MTDPAPSLPPPPDSSFASDNAAGVLPEVMAALAAANVGPALAYGADPWTERAAALVGDVLGEPGAQVAFCWGGTGANVVGLQCLLRPWEGVICPDTAHINVDECGAPERFTGAKLLALPTPDGKLRPEHIAPLLHVVGDEHHVQPRVVSITQSTESGTLYRPDEVAALAEVAHAHDLYLHLDGARLANAAAALGDVRSFTTEAGVDVLTFGATKAGAMYGEAVVFLRPGLGEQVRFVRKQAAQLPSKMRFVAAQFEALLTDDLWVRSADRANGLALLLAHRLAGRPGVEVVRPPEVNSVFLRLPSAAAVADLQDWSFVWDWDVAAHEVRAMTSFATTPDDVERFATGVAAVAARHL
jgi:threonine aldolase